MDTDDTTATPVKTVTTTPPRNTYVDVGLELKDGYLLYRPEDNSLIALYPQEFLQIRAEAEANNRVIEELQAANQAVTEASLALLELKRNPVPTVAALQQAQLKLDQALNDLALKSEAAKTRIEPIADLTADPNRLVELLPLTQRRETTQKNWYIPSGWLNGISADGRILLLDGPAERNKGPKEKLFYGSHLNHAELKRRLAQQALDKVKFENKWKLKPEDGDMYAGQFFEKWARTMGAQIQDFIERGHRQVVEGVAGTASTDKSNPYRRIDLKSEAQLMRWAAGAGLEANFQPLQGDWFDEHDKTWKQRFVRAAKAAQFNVKANAEASFAVGEAKVQTIGYFPDCAGWHLAPVMPSGPKNLGHFRLRANLSLYAVAGASMALEAGAGMLLTGSKQSLHGVPRASTKANVDAKSKVSLFAGLKEGANLKGSLQWLNPEGFIDEENPIRKDPTKTWGEYVDVANVAMDVAAIQGLAASFGFEVGYANGRFVIAANTAVCLGLGGSKSIAFDVEVDCMGQFIMCLAHQFKQADYIRLTDLMKPPIFNAFNQILFLLQSNNHTLRDIFKSAIGRNLRDINEAYDEAVNGLRLKGKRFILDLEKKLKKKWGWYAYMPPESRGAMIATLIEIVNDPRHAQDYEIKQIAAFCANELLATSQSVRHLDNTLDRITVAIGEKNNRDTGVSLIENLMEDSSFASGLQRAQKQVAAASPMIHRPFMRNDESDFIVAQLPFSHPTCLA